MSVSYLATEKDYTSQLDGAADLQSLRDVLSGWSPFVEDAEQVAAKMDAESFNRWRVGLQQERSKQFAGEAWAEEFGAILTPAKLIDGLLVADYYKVTLGCALIRMEEGGYWTATAEEAS